MLETWHAGTYLGPTGKGRTCSFILNCYGPIGPPGSSVLATRRDFVVKCLDLPEVTARGLFCEAFGNQIARELGIQTPKPALIEFDQEAADDVTTGLRKDGVLNSPQHAVRPGIGVGTEYFQGGFRSVDSDFRLRNDDLVRQAHRILAFDWLVQNPDRRISNPNCAVLKDQLWAFDFELCFSFLLALVLGTPEPPYNVVKHNQCSDHLFYRQLSGEKLDFSAFLDALENLSDARLAQLAADLPAAWQAHAQRVIAHLGEIRDHRHEFEIELHRGLAKS